MGLDNGIILKNVNREEVPMFLFVEDDIDSRGYLNVCYWRKHWGLRDEILGVLRDGGNGEGYFDVTKDNVHKIAEIIREYCNCEYYEENARSIWDYEEAMHWLPVDEIRVKWLAEYLEKHPDAEAYFYDSY